MLAFLVNERGIEPIVIKKINQFVFFMFGYVLLLHFLNFLRRATRLDCFLKAYKSSETNSVFRYQRIDDTEKLNNTQLLPFETSFRKLRNNNPAAKEYSNFQSLKDGGLTSEEASSKLKLNKPPGAGQENYQYLTSVSGSKKTCVPSKTFCVDITTRTLFLQ